MRHRLPIALIALALLLAACASPSGSVEESTAPEESTAASEAPAESADTSEGPAASVTPGEGEMTSVFELEVGDCFNDAEDSIVNEVEVVDCAAGHRYEIYGSAEYAAEDGDAYVGEEVLQGFVEEECIGMFEPFVGMAYADSDLFIYYLAPTEDSWDEGDREVLCAVYLPDQFLEGTAEGSAR